MAALQSCNFFYTSFSGGLTWTALHPTPVSASAVNHTSVTLHDWMYESDSSNSGAIEVWLLIHTEDKRSPSVGGASAFRSTLLAGCQVGLPCPRGAGALVLRSAAVFADGATENELRVVYACEGAGRVSLHEQVYRWVAQQLIYLKERVLLAVEGGTPPYTVYAVEEDSAQSGLVVLQSNTHTHVFHLRTGRAVRDGVVPPIAELPTQWSLAHDAQRRHSFRHGCITEGLVGLISYDPHRHTSTFHLSALPMPQLTTAPSAQARVLLEVTTPVLYDADGDLLAFCGVAQRLVYTRCRLTRTHLQLSPLMEQTAIVLEGRVEGAASGRVDAPDSVTWHACGRQRYESAVRWQRSTDTAEWSVEPLHKVWSTPVLDVKSADDFESTPTLFRSALKRALVGERRAIACSAEWRITQLLFRFAGTDVKRSCFVRTSTLSSLNPPAGTMEAAFMSASCRRMATTWWQPSPSLPSRFVCAATHCSVSEWLLLCMVSCAVLLFIRLSLRCGVVQRWRRCVGV
ncbi:hypothetical protein ABL78_4279 [Leptomonas seymouri]|uniref:Uncharacterized protein n=1 Tax=Leptomonas seymouri TaxID=5684 RepID=A0A0N1PD48_LEPSE|nr:hypothetical protein ABL78_4279 [Leptomonas seymouri]|eukprot:KPI86664.1 hypothetical protein ABL78_4279 [Leptomonas seymouri]